MPPSSSLMAPAAMRRRNSVGPNQPNDMRKTPRACVARNDSAETSSQAARTDTAMIGVMWPDSARPAISIDRPGEVDHVVHVEAVARPLAVADPGDGAVEAVAGPVEEQEHDDQREGDLGRDAGGPERQPDAEHRDEPERREMVRVDPGRQAPGDPDEQPLLGRGQQASMMADVLAGLRGGPGRNVATVGMTSKPPAGGIPLYLEMRKRRENRLTAVRRR